MVIARTILTIIYFIVSLAVIILALIQAKEDGGASATIVGSSSTNNFFEKNKGKTKEGKQKRWTIILSIIFAILTLVLGILYMA